MLLITEIFNDDVATIVEASTEGGKKSHFIEGIFMQGNLKNRNGRIYPSQTLAKEMNRYNEAYIKTKRALGELNHPQGPTINADRVSHLITNMKQEGDNFVGKAKILSTPMGEIVKTFIDEGVKIGVSTRGLGSVKPTNGIMEVQDDFYLATVDIVTDPSGPDCFVNGIMENTEFYYDIATQTWNPTHVARTVEEIKEEVKKSVKLTRNVHRIDEVVASRMFQKFINSLKEGSIPSTEHNGRLAVSNGDAKIRKIGGSKIGDKFYKDRKEIGHSHNGRDYFEPHVLHKHGWRQLTNAHMDM